MSIIHQFPGLSDRFINIRIQSRCGAQTQNSSHSLHHSQLFNHYPNTISPYLTSSFRLWNCSFHLLSSYYVTVIDQFTQTLSSFQNPDIFISTQILNMGVNLTLTSISYMQLFADTVKLFIFNLSSIIIGLGGGGVYGDRSGYWGRGELVPKQNHNKKFPHPTLLLHTKHSSIYVQLDNHFKTWQWGQSGPKYFPGCRSSGQISHLGANE